MVDIAGIFNVKGKIWGSPTDVPKHAALIVEGTKQCLQKTKGDLGDCHKQKYINIMNIAKVCVKTNIPICTFHLPQNEISDEEGLSVAQDALIDFLNKLSEWPFIKENQIKVSVLGKWYDLPSKLVEPIKRIIEDTKDYDKFFFNLCLNYNGQEEIIDAFRVLARLVKAEKLDPDGIDKQMVKDNIYTSFFLPPDLIIKTGSTKSIGGFLLWDSPSALIHFADKVWQDFGKGDFYAAVDMYKQHQKK